MTWIELIWFTLAALTLGSIILDAATHSIDDELLGSWVAMFVWISVIAFITCGIASFTPDSKTVKPVAYQRFSENADYLYITVNNKLLTFRQLGDKEDVKNFKNGSSLYLVTDFHKNYFGLDYSTNSYHFLNFKNNEH